MKLYTFFRSSASYRVRIALNLKGISCEQAPIHLRRGGGEQLTAAYRAINPQALVRSMALAIACEVHLIQNLRVLNYVKATYNQSDAQVNQWAQHWIDLGLAALQETITAQSKRAKFCYGDTATLADVCLIPQLGNARRYGCDLAKYPTILEIEKNCNALPAFANAAPEKQSDAE